MFKGLGFRAWGFRVLVLGVQVQGLGFRAFQNIYTFATRKNPISVRDLHVGL